MSGTILSSTGRIIVHPFTGAISIINAGPQGPPGVIGPEGPVGPTGPPGESSLPFVSVTDVLYGAVGNGVTDDRPAIQAAHDAAGVGGTVYYPPGKTYLIASATIPGETLIKTYPGQTIIGEGKHASVIKIGASIGNYRTVFGAATPSTYVGNWAMIGIGVDQNAANGNALDIANMGTYPRCVLYLGSYTAGSSVTVEECGFFNGDNVNTLYVFADTISVQRNLFTGTGGPNTTGTHDHSSVYTTTTVAGGTQTVSNNIFRGTAGSGGATAAIETHGGTQAVIGNTVSNYQNGGNLTCIAEVARTDGIVCSGNALHNVAVGFTVYCSYTTGIPSGTIMRNVEIVNNTCTIDRDTWAARLTTNSFIRLAMTNTAAIEGLKVAHNQITYLPWTSDTATDQESCGLKLSPGNPARVIYDLDIDGNTIMLPIAAGIHINMTIIRGKVRNNTVINPAESDNASVADGYDSAVRADGTHTLLQLYNNLMHDSRATHEAEYCCYVNSTGGATECEAWDNRSWHADAAVTTPRCPLWPTSTSNTAGREWYLRERGPAGVLAPFFKVKVGSTILNTVTGVTVKETTAPSGTTWA